MVSCGLNTVRPSTIDYMLLITIVCRSLLGIDRRESISKTILDYKVDCFNVIMRKHVLGFRNRLFKIENVLIQKCVSYGFFILGRRINATWLSPRAD